MLELLRGHPNFVRLLDAFVVAPAVRGGESQAWLVMTDGGPNLSTVRSKTGGLRNTMLTVLARSLAEGLGHLHALGFLHADLKPPNIVMSPDSGDGPSFVIADLGSCLPADRGVPSGALASKARNTASPEKTQYITVEN
jgi:serine/threonine protein kinase